MIPIIKDGERKFCLRSPLLRDEYIRLSVKIVYFDAAPYKHINI